MSISCSAPGKKAMLVLAITSVWDELPAVCKFSHFRNILMTMPVWIWWVPASGSLVFGRLTDHGHLLLKTYGTAWLTAYVWMPLGCRDMQGRERACPAAAETAPRFLPMQWRSASIVTRTYVVCWSMNWKGSAALIYTTNTDNNT